MLDRPQKITFAEMLASGVRGILIYCSDYDVATGLRSAAIDGRMTCACPILSPGLPARRAGGVVRMCGRTFLKRGWARAEGGGTAPSEAAPASLLEIALPLG
jgi:hypothetical protein